MNHLKSIDQLENAVKYLLASFNKEKKKWTDNSSVGTGHRRLLYMQYPVYALAWPLMALGRYKALKQQQQQQQLNQNNL